MAQIDYSIAKLKFGVLYLHGHIWFAIPDKNDKLTHHKPIVIEQHRVVVEHPSYHLAVSIGLELNLDDILLLLLHGFFQKIGSPLTGSLKTRGQVRQFTRTKPTKFFNDGRNDTFYTLADNLVVILVFAHLV